MSCPPTWNPRAVLKIHNRHEQQPEPARLPDEALAAHSLKGTRLLSLPTLGFDAEVMMPLICTSWLTRLLLSSRMLLGPKG